MRSYNKKLGAVAAAAIAALVLSACGSGTSGETADSSAPGSSTSEASSPAADASSEAGVGASSEVSSEASSEAPAPADPVTLAFNVGFGSDSPQLAKLQEITEAYHAANPTVTVEINSVADYEADMKVRMAANNMPDLFVTHGWSLLRYSPFLEPLNDQPWAANFNESLAPAMKNADGQFFALPINTDVSGIVYGQAALDKVGVDPASLKTWDEFNTALGKLKAAGVIPISASSKDAWLAGDIADFITTGGFDQAALDGFKNGTFDKAGYLKLMELVEGWASGGYFNPDFVSATQNDIAQNLTTGDTAFVIVQNGIVSNALEFDPNAKLGFMPVPTFDGKPFLIGGEDYAIGVAKDSKNKEAALAFLAYMAQPEQLTAQAEVVRGLPGLTDAKVDLGLLQPSFDTFVTAENPLLPYFDRVYLPGGAWDAMIDTISGIVTGQMTAAQATDEMASQYESLRAQQN